MIFIDNLSKSYNGNYLFSDVTIGIKRGMRIGLVGANGAGKTTLFNVIAGFYPPTSGSVLLEDEDITGFSPHKLFECGILRTFQIPHEFGSLSVMENLMMVPSGQNGERLLDVWFKPNLVKSRENQVRRRADEVIEFLELKEVCRTPARNLSGGQKKLLELGRTMMVDAKIVFLDEVGAGVNKSLLKEISESILKNALVL